MARQAGSLSAPSAKRFRTQSPGPPVSSNPVLAVGELAWKALKLCKSLRLRIEALESQVQCLSAGSALASVAADQAEETYDEQPPGAGTEEQDYVEMSA